MAAKEPMLLKTLMNNLFYRDSANKMMKRSLRLIDYAVFQDNVLKLKSPDSISVDWVTLNKDTFYKGMIRQKGIGWRSIKLVLRMCEEFAQPKRVPVDPEKVKAMFGGSSVSTKKSAFSEAPDAVEKLPINPDTVIGVDTSKDMGDAIAYMCHTKKREDPLWDKIKANMDTGMFDMEAMRILDSTEIKIGAPSHLIIRTYRDKIELTLKNDRTGMRQTVHIPKK